MADEDLAIAQPAVETPSEPPEPVETPEIPELPQDILEVGEEDAEQPADGGDEDESAELDFAFKKYSVPKSLKEAVEAMRADYTHKTQSTAETAKALADREAAITQQAEATEAELDARATLKGVTSRLAEYAKLTAADWQHHMQNDPLGTQQARMEYEDLKAQKMELEGIVNKASTERTEKAQQALAKRVQETLEAAPKVIPGLTAENRTATIDKLIQFAHSEGISEQVLKDNWSPTLLGLLHKAHIGSQAIAKQSAARPAPKPAIAPLATVKAATAPAASRSLSDLANSDDMEAYAAARAAGKKR